MQLRFDPVKGNLSFKVEGDEEEERVAFEGEDRFRSEELYLSFSMFREVDSVEVLEGMI